MAAACAGAWLLVRRADSWPRAIAAGAALAACAMLRPEGHAIVLFAALARPRTILPALAILVPYHLLRMHYFGALVPLPFYVKGAAPSLASGLLYGGMFLLFFGHIVLLYFALRLRRRRRARLFSARRCHRRARAARRHRSVPGCGRHAVPRARRAVLRSHRRGRSTDCENVRRGALEPVSRLRAAGVRGAPSRRAARPQPAFHRPGRLHSPKPAARCARARRRGPANFAAIFARQLLFARHSRRSTLSHTLAHDRMVATQRRLLPCAL